MKKKTETRTLVFLFLEITLVLFFLFLFLPFFVNQVFAEISGNATVDTEVTVGNVYPEVLNVSIDYGNPDVDLTSGSTKVIQCVALVRDYTNDSDFDRVKAEFFDNTVSNYSGEIVPSNDDKNMHYSNTSCILTIAGFTWNGFSDDNYTALANCTFNVEYYAYPRMWNCTVYVNDTNNWNATGSDNITINSLLAVSLPETINYGTVNATAVSAQNTTNVTNAGNVEINLSLHGYAAVDGDNFAMNCTQGNSNISISFEKYNLSTSNTSVMNLSVFESVYLNLTGTANITQFDLDSRENDALDEATKETYWRIYVPVGVAGTCEGNIVFGATTAPTP